MRVAGRAEEPAFEADDAEVWLEAAWILVSYFDDDGMVVFEGRADGEGGYELAARSRPWRAFLRPMADAPGSFAGEIDAQGESVAWQLVLGAAAPAP